MQRSWNRSSAEIGDKPERAGATNRRKTQFCIDGFRSELDYCIFLWRGGRAV